MVLSIGALDCVRIVASLYLHIGSTGNFCWLRSLCTNQLIADKIASIFCIVTFLPVCSDLVHYANPYGSDKSISAESKADYLVTARSINGGVGTAVAVLSNK